VAFLLAAPALRAQTIPVEELRAALLADLETMRVKYVGLAEAFPQDKYDWRPMEGVRSVAEVLMLASFEGYSFVPRAFGGQTADLGGREAAERLRTLNDKAQVIEHLTKGFAHAKAVIEAIDATTLGASRQLQGGSRTAPELAVRVMGDLHEHLGQLIAYARVNRIVPPWSQGRGGGAGVEDP
jgi:hypothetical protein